MIFQVDLGQIIIATLIAVVGFFIRKEITTIARRIDRHEDILFRLGGNVQRLIGYHEAMKDK